MERSLISLSGISKSYSAGSNLHWALKDVSLNIQHGEFVVIVGQSGSGKSTLLNILGCLDSPTEGTYELNGHEISDVTSSAVAKIRGRTIGFVFQNFQLLPRLSMLDNVALPAIYAGINRNQARRSALKLLEQFDVAQHSERRPAELSGGQQQRCAIARSLINQPPVLLADEPTGNLDSATAALVLEKFSELNAKDGISIVLITHDMQIAAGAQRRIELRDGSLYHDSGIFRK